MIKPTIGRVVWFWPSIEFVAYRNDFAISSRTEPCAAIVSKVLSDHVVNLAVFDQNGRSHPVTLCPLIQDGDEMPSGSYCEWMPYQKGQAAKTEQLEKKLSEG